MYQSKKLCLYVACILSLVAIQSCQEPDIKAPDEVALKGIPIPPDPAPNPIFSLYAIQNNNLVGVDPETGATTTIGPAGFWSGASAMTVNYSTCGNPDGAYTINVVRGNTFYAINPERGTIIGGGSAPVLATTRLMFGYYLTRIITESHLFFNLGCPYGLRPISASWNNAVAAATVSHVNDVQASRVETNYVVRNGSMYKIIANTAVLVGAAGSWEGTQAMTSIGDQLYIVQMNALHRMDTRTETRTRISAIPSTEELASVGESLYAVMGGTLYRVDPADGNATQIGTPGAWTGTVALVNLPTPRSF